MMVRWMKNMGLALSFGTIVPLPDLGSIDDKTLRSSVGFLPIVGLILGLALWGLNAALAQMLPREMAAIIVLALYIIATGGLHLDGLMDTMDAIGSRKLHQEALAVMKDSRVGAMGAIAASLLLIGKALAFSKFPITANPGPWVAVPMIARTTAIWSMAWSPAATEHGLGSLYAQKIPRTTMTVATMGGLLGLWVFLPIRAAAILLLLSVGMTLAWTRFVRHRFGGSTGDTYGALIEMVEWLGFLILTGGWVHG